MFGDNKSVVDSASIPTSTLSKKSTLASLESEKLLLHDISNSAGKMQNLILETSQANVGNLEAFGPY